MSRQHATAIRFEGRTTPGFEEGRATESAREFTRAARVDPDVPFDVERFFAVPPDAAPQPDGRPLCFE
jgi:hypothetical protein